MDDSGEMRVLIIEDEESTAGVLRLLLKSGLKASSDIVPDCVSARRKLASRSYDLITVDYQLPDGDGLSLMEEVLAKEDAPPLIMVTGHGDEETAVSAFKLGASGYVVKDKRMSTMLIEEARSAIARAGYAKMEPQLRDSLARLDAAQEVAAIGFWSVDLPSRKVEWTDGVRSIFEFEPTDLTPSYLEFLDFVHPADRDTVSELAEKQLSPMQGPISYTYRIITRKGNLRYLAHRGQQLFDESGMPVRVFGSIQDITEHELSEEILLAREAFLEAVTNSARDAIILIDGDANFCRWNAAAEKMFGYAADEVLGHGESIIVAEDNRQLYTEAMRKLLETGEGPLTMGKPAELTVRKKDGTIFPVEATTARFLVSGQPYAVAVIRDITDRKRAEEELENKERRLSLMFDKVADVMFYLVVEPDGRYRFLSANSAFLEATGLAEDQVIGKYVDEVVPEPSLTLVLGKYKRAIEENRTMTWEEVTDYPAGRKYGDVRATPIFDSSGRCTNILGSVHDMTDWKAVEQALRQSNAGLEAVNQRLLESEEMLKRSESKFRSIFDAANDAIYVHDMQTGRILDVNQKTCDMYKGTREEILSRAVEDFSSGQPPFSQQEALTLIRRASDEGPQLFEWRAKDMEGGLFWVEVNLKLADIAGEQRILAIVRDISERKAAEEALQRANIELEGYAHTVSHDLRGPLSSVVAAVEMLSGMLKDTEGFSSNLEAMQVLGMIEHGTIRALDLTENLLSLAEAGEEVAVQAPLDISEVVRSVLLDKETLLEGPEIKVSIEGDLGVAIVDPTHAYQIFSNLISNSIVYNNSKEPEIHISRLEDTETGALRYLVCDNGPGFPEGADEDIFLPFYKGLDSKGSGIGLSIVAKVVKLYGGHVRAYNDMGACLEFTLPRYSP
jgi:PAS domain S-box-containing protein